MREQSLIAAGLAGLLALGVACAGQPAEVLSPSGGTGGTDASTETLKVGAPTPIAPINDQQPTLLMLTASSAPQKFVTPGALQYNFEIYNSASARVVNDTVTGPSDTVTAPLNVGQRYTWRVRAVLNGAFGPFSSTASFIAPAGGYNIAGELYDPLINGRTLGNAHGRVEFLPGVGIKLTDRTSYVDYQLPATIDSGEISAVVTNISSAPGQPGLKTRVFSMSQGYANMTDNPRRFTIEKRNGAEAGAIAWRVITSGNQIETDSPQTRLIVNFSPSQSYLFRATWGGGRFNLTIDQVGGGRLYEMGKNYLGSYNPTPHIVFLGSPDSTSGPDTQTVPGIVLRQLWVGAKARPGAISQ